MYRDLIEKVCDFLRSGNTPVEITYGKPVTASELDQLEERLGFELPKDYRDFYIDVGNGIELSRVDANDTEDIWVWRGFFTLEKLFSWHRFVQELYVESKIDYDFPFVEDTAKARQVLEAKRQWLDMWEEGGRFTISLDCKSGHVLDNDHLWWSCDFNAQLQGQLIAKSFSEFFKKWASVCFWNPFEPAYDPKLFKDTLPWNSKIVPDRYRLPD